MKNTFSEAVTINQQQADRLLPPGALIICEYIVRDLQNSPTIPLLLNSGLPEDVSLEINEELHNDSMADAMTHTLEGLIKKEAHREYLELLLQNHPNLVQTATEALVQEPSLLIDSQTAFSKNLNALVTENPDSSEALLYTSTAVILEMIAQSTRNGNPLKPFEVDILVGLLYNSGIPHEQLILPAHADPDILNYYADYFKILRPNTNKPLFSTSRRNLFHRMRNGGQSYQEYSNDGNTPTNPHKRAILLSIGVASLLLTGCGGRSGVVAADNSTAIPETPVAAIVEELPSPEIATYEPTLASSVLNQTLDIQATREPNTRIPGPDDPDWDKILLAPEDVPPLPTTPGPTNQSLPMDSNAEPFNPGGGGENPSGIIIVGEVPIEDSTEESPDLTSIATSTATSTSTATPRAARGATNSVQDPDSGELGTNEEPEIEERPELTPHDLLTIRNLYNDPNNRAVLDAVITLDPDNLPEEVWVSGKPYELRDIYRFILNELRNYQWIDNSDSEIVVYYDTDLVEEMNHLCSVFAIYTPSNRNPRGFYVITLTDGSIAYIKAEDAERALQAKRPNFDQFLTDLEYDDLRVMFEKLRQATIEDQTSPDQVSTGN